MSRCCSNCPGDLAYSPAFSATTYQAHIGDIIVFTADEGRMVAGSVPLWDLGDTEHRSGNPLSYSYSTPGVFSVRLTISERNFGTWGTPRISPVPLSSTATPRPAPTKWC